MQVLAGHPQFCFYTGIGAGLYALLNLRNAPSPLRSMIGLAAMFAAGAALAAVQLAPGLAVAGETVRTRLDPKSAGDSSLPPEAIPSVIVPGLFGPYRDTQGNWAMWSGSFWESSLFVGLTVLSLALFAIRTVPTKSRRFAFTLSVLSLLVAMGKYTPLFHIVYHLPGFASFRSWGRFDMLVMLFLAMLAGLGLDRLLRGERPGRRPAILLGTLAVLLLGGALLLLIAGHGGASGLWGRGLAMRARLASHAHYQVTADYVRETAGNAAAEMLRTGCVALTLAAVWWAARRDRRAAYPMVLMAALELIGFARRYRPTFDWPTFNANNLATAQRLHELDGSDRMFSGLQDSGDPLRLSVGVGV